MKYKKQKNAQSILEIVVAMGIFIIVLTSISALYISSINGTSGIDKEYRAEMYLNQAFEATRAIRDNNFSSLTIASHGLDKGGGYWEFIAASDTLGDFTRTTRIDEVQRNAECAIVESGGTVDTDSRKITVTVNWDQSTRNPKTISATQYMQNWENPQPCGQQSNDLILDVHNAYIVQNKKLRGITLENIGSALLTIDKITMTWTAESSDIEWIKIAGAKNWDYMGIGSPSGRQPSGTELDIIDFTLEPAQVQEIQEFKFENNMEGSYFTLTIILSDGSSVEQNFSVDD